MIDNGTVYGTKDSIRYIRRPGNLKEMTTRRNDLSHDSSTKASPHRIRYVLISWSLHRLWRSFDKFELLVRRYG